MQERERVAAMLVRHMVFKQSGQPRVPVKREELVGIVQEVYPNSKGLVNQVIPIAARMCRELLGFEMVEVGSGLSASERQQQAEDSQLSQAQVQSQALASGKVFVLQSTVKPELLQQHVASDDAAQDAGLRLLVCTLIQGSGEYDWRYYTVLYKSVLYYTKCTVLHCSLLHCTVLYCTVLYCTVLH